MLPYLIQTPEFAIPSYYFMVMLGTSAALVWGALRADSAGVPRTALLDSALVGMSAGFVGARLGHVLYEAPYYFAAHPERIIEFWDGGFVFYAGLISGLLGALFWARRKGLPLGKSLDVAAPPLALAYAIGRLGCLLNGCCYGLESHLTWAIQERHPTPLYASLLELGILTVLVAKEKWKGAVHPGHLFWTWIGLHGAARILMESFRGDDRGYQPLGFSISTWVSFFLIVTSLLGLRLWDTRRNHAPHSF